MFHNLMKFSYIVAFQQEAFMTIIYFHLISANIGEQYIEQTAEWIRALSFERTFYGKEVTSI